MADLTVHVAPVAGGLSIHDIAVSASGGGDTAPVGSARMLAVINTDTDPHTVTIPVTRTLSGLAIEDAVVTVPGGEVGLIPLSPKLASVDGRAQITYDSAGDIDVAVIELGR